MTPGGEWQPLLDGSLRGQALETIGDIAEALRHPVEPTPFEDLAAETTQTTTFGLMTGRAGIAVFFAYLAEAGLHQDAEELAWDFLEESEAGLAEQGMGASLCEGFTGIAWAHAHLHQALSHARDRGELKDLDEALLALLRDWPNPDQYELLYGLVGIGVYALERLPRPRARTMVRLILERLKESAQHSSDGIAWKTPQSSSSPIGEFNLGMAHGIPGVVAFLARAAAAPVQRQKALSLLGGAVNWLRSQRLTPEKGGGFPASITPGELPIPTRLAWCYGDPGVTTALLPAARMLELPELEKEAIQVAISAGERRTEESGVVDAGLCHGAAGVGHLYHRLYRATGDVRLRAIARRWFAHTLELRRPGTGVAGFAPADSPENQKVNAGERIDAGVLSGTAGIGLALLAATTPVPPLWDRLLLADLPSMAVRAGRNHLAALAPERR
jgi:lantibiotic modifying enzyme